MNYKCNLIIDSCCDLPKEMWDVPGVTMLPFSYSDDMASYVDDSFQTRTPHEFYEWIGKGATPTTSQPSQMVYEEAFRAAVESGVPTVYLCMSSGISGAYNGALMALDRMKREFGEGIELYVVDTLIGSTPLGLLVQEAMHLQQSGMTARELADWALEARYFTHIIFMVEDLECLHRGGRIPASVAVAGTKLDVKPLLTFDLQGKLSIIGASRGRKKGMKRMVDFYMKNRDVDSLGKPIAVGNADVPHDVDKLEALLTKQDEGAMFLNLNIGPTIGCHVGPGMLSCCFWGNDRRKNLSVSDRIANRVKSN